MSIQRNDSLLIAAPKDVDSRYDNDGSHFTSVSEANAGINAAFRYQGLTVGILSGGVVTEYWYRDGVADVDLIQKTSGSSLSNILDNDIVSPGSVIIGAGKTSGGNVNISLDVLETNAGIVINTKGTGTISASPGHTSNISADHDLITKLYFDNNAPAGSNPAGLNTQLQFNNAGSFGASSSLTFGSDVLNAAGVQIGSGIGAYSALRLGSSSLNVINAQGSAADVLVAVGGDSVSSNGAYMILSGTSHVTNPGRAKIEAKGAGSVVFSSGNNERLTIDNAGQITAASSYTPSDDFDLATKVYVDSASQSTSGSWTPRIEDAIGGEAGYTSRVGRYFKFGNMVYIDAYIEINSKAGMSLVGVNSYLQLHGLPFTHDTNNQPVLINVAVTNLVDNNVDSVYLNNESAGVPLSDLSFFQWVSGAISNLTTNGISTNSVISISGWYVS